MAKKFIDVPWRGDRDIKTFAQELVAQTIDTDKIKQQMEEALDIVEETTMRYVPVDTGATKESFYREVEVTADAIIGRAGYNRDGRLDYVGVIHEDPYGFSFVNSRTKGGQPEARRYFLNNAFTENRDKIIDKFKG